MHRRILRTEPNNCTEDKLVDDEVVSMICLDSAQGFPYVLSYSLNQISALTSCSLTVMKYKYRRSIRKEVQVLT